VKPTAPANRAGPPSPATCATSCCAGCVTECWGLSDTLSAGTRPGERKARLLLEVLRDRPADVLRFAHDLKVPPTSNQAERDLRPSKVQQNTSGRLTSEERTRDRYTIRGYVSTAIKHGHDAITVLRDALTGNP